MENVTFVQENVEWELLRNNQSSEKVLKNEKSDTYFFFNAIWAPKMSHSLKIQTVYFTHYLMPVIRYNFRKT